MIMFGTQFLVPIPLVWIFKDIVNTFMTPIYIRIIKGISVSIMADPTLIFYFIQHWYKFCNRFYPLFLKLPLGII